MQLVLVLLAIAGAIFYLVRRFVRSYQRKQKPGCEKCGLNPEQKQKAS